MDKAYGQGAVPPSYSQHPPPYPGTAQPAGFAPPPQQGYPPPQQGYPPPPQGYLQQPMIQPRNAPTTTVVMAQPVTTTTVIRVGGNCPACGVGILSEEYSMVGIVLAILFFPWGILCCLAMTEKRCSHCRRVY